MSQPNPFPALALALTCASLALLSPTTTRADEDVATEGRERARWGLGLEAVGATAVDDANGELFGLGGGGAIDLELAAHPLVGLHLGATGLLFSREVSPEKTEWLGARAGARIHWGVLAGAISDDGWIDAHFNFGTSGEVSRGGFDLGLGYEASLAEGFRVGPLVRYHFGHDPQGNHAHLLMAGLSFGFFGDPRVDVPAPAPPAITPANPDADGDGILNASDVCPATPAGAEPDPRRPGCPSSDADADGVFDVADVCPLEPAGARPDPAQPGCPERDQDRDAVVDREDHCPEVAAGASPDPSRPGCPAGDRDGDGVLDGRDGCPDQHRGPNPDPRRPGCPLPDRDGDSVADGADACPDAPGAPSRDPSRNGCPGLVRIVDGQIQIMEPVFFATDSARILPRSRAVLDAVVDAVGALGIRRIRVEGHTDSTGSDAYNEDLSRRRAQSVLRRLVESDVEASGLEAVGHGETRPLADNSSDEGRAENRRVEFHILDAAFAPRR